MRTAKTDQTGRMPRLIWVFAGRTLILLVLSCHRSNEVIITVMEQIWGLKAKITQVLLFTTIETDETNYAFKMTSFLFHCEVTFPASSNEADMSHSMIKDNKMTCAPSEYICQVRSKSSLCALSADKDPSFHLAYGEDLSDWADAQADLSLRWAHMPCCWFCLAAAHIRNTVTAYKMRKDLLLETKKLYKLKQQQYHRPVMVITKTVNWGNRPLALRNWGLL